MICTIYKKAICLLVSCILFATISNAAINEYYEEISIQLDDAKMPLLSGSFGKKSYLLGLDLGSPEFAFDKSVLATIPKIPKGIKKSEDGLGNKYEEPSYIIPHFNIQSLKWKNILIREQDPSFDQNTTIWEDPDKASVNVEEQSFGRIGRYI